MLTAPHLTKTAAPEAPYAASVIAGGGEGAQGGDGHPRTLWGLTSLEVHDRFWAARGVQVVRQGEPTELAQDAELFLLTDRSCLSIFRLGQLIDTLSWLNPRILFVRLHTPHDRGYQERIITDDHDRFVRFERVYGDADWRLARVAMTPSRELAQRWMAVAHPRPGWREIRRSISANQRATLSIEGQVFDRHHQAEVDQFIHELVRIWRRPDVTIARATAVNQQVWTDPDLPPTNGTRFIGPVWIGAGRSVDHARAIVGPAVMWDRPEDRPQPAPLQWNQIQRTDTTIVGTMRPRALTSFQRASKRIFDIAFALPALALTLPLYPLVMLAIYLEDGRPFFFAHKRESRGGREFPCIKFRTMRKDAEKIKRELMTKNQADGPQFFIAHDPRLTRVGRLLRRTNIDELPQFFNVLVGHMSVVGPRPSPYAENQFCPAWREARLSVRPGITGLWQVKRSREDGKDFQEWIRYDIQYVENFRWRTDLAIIWKTMGQCLGAA